LADIHRLSSEERRIYLSGAMSSCADEQDYSIMHRSKRAKMDNYDEGVSSSSQNGDIFDSDDEKEHSSEEDSNSEENGNSEEGDSKEESEEHEIVAYSKEAKYRCQRYCVGSTACIN
jgi:Mg-chelatase subunit ChlI